MRPRIYGDAVDAVALAKQYGPALIVMDMIMPGKDGVEACAELRKEGVTIPIVILPRKPTARIKSAVWPPA